VQSRIDILAQGAPEALQALQRLGRTVRQDGLPATLHYLLELRASQINGCAICVDMHSRELKAAGEPDRRINLVAAWREAPYYTDAERAALALTEAVTRLADRPDPVPDEIWNEAARHFDEAQLAALVIAIATINTANRINAATRQITGDWIEQFTAQQAAAAA
jgi:AhpD family alkylhydroperoxidase